VDPALSDLAVQSLNVGVAVLDSDTRIVLFNQWLVRASGLSVEDVAGRTLASLFTEWGKGRLAQALQSALTLGQPVVLSHALNRAPLPLHWDPKARRDGQRMAQAVQLLPLTAHGKRYCSLQVVDVSAAVVREQRLHELATQARDARNAQREFLARMSHEIRTPMNGVIALCELLLLTELDAEQRETLDVIHNSSHSLLSIINDVLDFSKIDAGKMTISKSACDLRRMIRDVVAVLGARAAEKHVRLDIRVDEQVPDVVALDELRTRQVLLNLVGNAIKFTDAQGNVEVGARWVGESGIAGNLTLQVKDTGIGIANSQQLFQVYGQADASISKRFGGTGLGLAISKQLVELMGGVIGVQSVLGQGSTFWFTLPAEVASVVVPEPEPKSATMVRSGGRVLVVDDNRVNQLVASKILTQMGYQVTTVDDGQLALDAITHGRYDVVFMDCQMPVMDGYQATRELRARGYAHLPIIAVTAGAIEGEREICLEAGMTDYLSKPLTLKAVADMMDRLRSSAA
jgi:PAS domain S-box-containing protein